MSGDKGREPVIAAGCLVTRNEGSDTEVLLVHRPKYDDWSLPKGKLDESEHVLETAVREVHEETGLRVALRRPLPSREYLADGQPKVVHYWRAVVTSDEGFTPTKEIDDVQWLPVAAAVQRATHLLDGALIAQALIPPATPFVVLRHGKAMKRAAWDGPDIERPLDDAGAEQAQALVPLLATYGITRVHSSAATRCLRTVEPYARSIGTSVLPEPALSEEGFGDDPVAGLERAAQLLAASGRNRVPTVLCGHRPVMPATLAHLLKDSDVVGPTGTIPAGSFVVLHMDDGLAVAVEQHLLE